MDLDVFNRDPMLYNTPIGRLRLERHGVGSNSRVVVLLCPHGRFDPRAPARIVKRLEPGVVITDVIFGKRYWETPEVYAAYERQLAEEQAALVRESEADTAEFRSILARGERRLGTEGLQQAFAAAFQ